MVTSVRADAARHPSRSLPAAKGSQGQGRPGCRSGVQPTKRLPRQSGERGRLVSAGYSIVHVLGRRNSVPGHQQQRPFWVIRAGVRGEWSARSFNGTTGRGCRPGRQRQMPIRPRSRGCARLWRARLPEREAAMMEIGRVSCALIRSMIAALTTQAAAQAVRWQAARRARRSITSWARQARRSASLIWRHGRGRQRVEEARPCTTARQPVDLELVPARSSRTGRPACRGTGRRSCAVQAAGAPITTRSALSAGISWAGVSTTCGAAACTASLMADQQTSPPLFLFRLLGSLQAAAAPRSAGVPANCSP